MEKGSHISCTDALKRKLARSILQIYRSGVILYMDRFFDAGRRQENTFLFFFSTLWPSYNEAVTAVTAFETQGISAFDVLATETGVVLMAVKSSIDCVDGGCALVVVYRTSGSPFYDSASGKPESTIVTKDLTSETSLFHPFEKRELPNNNNKNIETEKNGSIGNPLTSWFYRVQLEGTSIVPHDTTRTILEPSIGPTTNIITNYRLFVAALSFISSSSSYLRAFYGYCFLSLVDNVEKCRMSNISPVLLLKKRELYS